MYKSPKKIVNLNRDLFGFFYFLDYFFLKKANLDRFSFEPSNNP